MISYDTFMASVNLDLASIKLRLMDPRSGEAWSQAKTEAMEQEYRRFLYLHRTNPDQPGAPTRDVDTFWHYHILDTQK